MVAFFLEYEPFHLGRRMRLLGCILPLSETKEKNVKHGTRRAGLENCSKSLTELFLAVFGARKREKPWDHALLYVLSIPARIE